MAKIAKRQTLVQKYSGLVEGLTEREYDLTKDPFTLTLGERSMYSELAQKCNYRRPAGAYHTLGACFYLLLQKVYRKMQAG